MEVWARKELAYCNQALEVSCRVLLLRSKSQTLACTQEEAVNVTLEVPPSGVRVAPPLTSREPQLSSGCLLALVPSSQAPGPSLALDHPDYVSSLGGCASQGGLGSLLEDSEHSTCKGCLSFAGIDYFPQRSF